MREELEGWKRGEGREVGTSQASCISGRPGVHTGYLKNIEKGKEKGCSGVFSKCLEAGGVPFKSPNSRILQLAVHGCW